MCACVRACMCVHVSEIQKRERLFLLCLCINIQRSSYTRGSMKLKLYVVDGVDEEHYSHSNNNNNTNNKNTTTAAGGGGGAEAQLYNIVV